LTLHRVGEVNDEEREAILALKNGDISGLETLVRFHQLSALRAVYAITGEYHTAEDVVADAFLKVYERIGQFDERRPFGSWFYRIVVNDALKVIQRTRRVRLGLDEGPVRLGVGLDSPAEPGDQATLHQVQRLVVEAVRALPPKQRMPLVLKYYLGFEEATIATILGSPLGTIKGRLRAAKERLRRQLAAQGISSAD